MRASRRLLTAALVVLGGCNFYYDTVPSPDDLVKLVPWFDHMVTSPAFHPYERADIPRRTVAGTVPVDAYEADWGDEWRAANTTTADALMNPTAGIATAVGDTLFGTYCAVCHGIRGAGDGPVRVGAPSLLTERARALADGNIYSIVRYGRGVMPRYGDKIMRPEHRWAVVNYVRRMQADQPLPGGAP